MYFALTTAGIANLNLNPGIAPTLAAFKLGSGSGYTPSQSQTGLLGLEVASGVPSGAVIQSSNLFKYTIMLDVTEGDYEFGECGLYLPGNILFAVGSNTTLIEKKKAALNEDGNSLVIDCYINAEGSAPSIYAELGNSDVAINLPSLSGIDSLPAAYNARPNTIQVPSPGQSTSVLAFSNNARWSVTGYDTEILTDIPAQSGTTPTVLKFAVPLQAPSSIGELLIQCITGLNAGSIRVVAGHSLINNTYQVNTAFLFPIAVGDKFSVSKRTYLTATAQAFLNGLEPTTTAAQTNGIQNIDLNKLFFTDGSRPAVGNWDMAGVRITQLGDPTADRDAIHKKWLDDTLAAFNTNVVQAGFNQPRIQFGLGAPNAGTLTSPPFYVDKSQADSYELYARDHTATTPAWIKLVPKRAQYGAGAPTLATPISPDLYYDTTTTAGKYMAYTYYNGSWRLVGQPDQGVNFVGGVTVSDTLDIGVNSATPLRATATGFSSNASGGINFSMTAIGLNASLRNRWTSTYAFTINTSGNETAAYELCRSNNAVGGIRLATSGSLEVGSRSNAAVQLLQNNAVRGSFDTDGSIVFTPGANAVVATNGLHTELSGIKIGAGSISTLVPNNDTIVARPYGYGMPSGSFPASIILGGNSGFSNTGTYGNNTVVGIGAGGTATTSNSYLANTVIGTNAASGVNNVTSSVIVGFSASVAAAATEAVTIGSSSTGASFSVAIGYATAAGASAVAVGRTSKALDYCVAVGSEAASRASNYTGTVAVGYAALRACATASNNTAVGSEALSKATSSDNTALGKQAGFNITTAAYNTAVGKEALFCSNTGLTGTGGNVALGAFALGGGAATTAYYNNAIGFEALRNITTGAGNNALGDGAIRALTTGSLNVGIGGSSLLAATTGNNNIAIGNSALAGLTTAGDNISIGVQSSWKSNSVGNLSIGNYSAQNITGGGAEYVALGDSAMRAAASSGSVIAIGRSALTSATAPVTTLAIGNSALSSTLNSINSVVIGNGAALNLRLPAISDHGVLVVGSNALPSHTTGDVYRALVVGNNTLESSNAQASFATLVGNRIGIGASNLNRSVIVGNSSATSASVTNSVYLGNDVLVNGSGSIAIIPHGTVAGGSLTNSIFVTTGNGSAVPTAYTLSSCIVIGGTPSAASATGEVTLGNTGTPTYRMYGTWSNVSDIRDKTNISDLSSAHGLSLITKLRPVNFTWNTRDGGRTGVRDTGFIAQEVLSAVGEKDNEVLKFVNTSSEEQLMLSSTAMIPSLVAAIKELAAEVSLLKAKLGE